MVSTTCFLQFFSVICLNSIVLSTKCQIQSGLFPTSGAKILNTTYSSGDMLLYYKMWIPPNIDITAIDLNDTLNIPILVLIHGSGPQNHEEQIPIPSSPDFYTFRDIADGLCRYYNIIVFSYDKRSCSPYAPIPCLLNQPSLCTMNNTADDWCFNIFNVTYLDFVGDAINAIKYIQITYPFINPSNIVPTGHSQGASIVPWIADYMNLSTSIALMGTGIPIDIVILYQQQELGVNQSVIDEEALTFKMIKNESINGWTLVNILGSPTPAIFWKQWLDAETNVSRLIHLKELENILTINSNTDWNVPPFTYEPLHDLINIVAGNISYNLHASMNIFPNMIHQMVSIDDVLAVRYNVSDDIIYLIGSWVNGVFGNIEFDSISPSLSPTDDTNIPSVMPTASPINDVDDNDEGILTLNEEGVIISSVIAGIIALLLVVCVALVIWQQNKIKRMKKQRYNNESKPVMYNSLETTTMIK